MRRGWCPELKPVPQPSGRAPQLSRHTLSTSSGGVDVLRIGKVRQRRGVRREITPGLVSIGTLPPDPVVDRRHLASKRRELLPAPAQPQTRRPGPTGSPGETRVPRLEDDPASRSHHQAQIGSGQTAPAPQPPLPRPIPIHI